MGFEARLQHQKILIKYVNKRLNQVEEDRKGNFFVVVRKIWQHNE